MRASHQYAAQLDGGHASRFWRCQPWPRFLLMRGFSSGVTCRGLTSSLRKAACLVMFSGKEDLGSPLWITCVTSQGREEQGWLTGSTGGAADSWLLPFPQEASSFWVLSQGPLLGTAVSPHGLPGDGRLPLTCTHKHHQAGRCHTGCRSGSLWPPVQPPS